MNKTLRTVVIVLAVIVGAAAVIAVGVFFFGGFGHGFLRHPMMADGFRSIQRPDGRFVGPRLMIGYSPVGFLGSLLVRLAGFGLLVALMVLLAWAASRYFGSRNAYVSQATAIEAQSVQEILDRRYARGEISREEYLQVLKDTGHATPDMSQGPEEPPAGA